MEACCCLARALVRHLLSVKPEFISPVLAVERPELVLLIHIDVAALRQFGFRHLLLKLLVDLAATEGRDFQLDGVDLIAELLLTNLNQTPAARGANLCLING